MKTKKKNIFRVLIALAVVIVVVYASLPYYARQALIHWMPVIDDLETFHRPSTVTRYTTIPMMYGTGPSLPTITAIN